MNDCVHASRRGTRLRAALRAAAPLLLLLGAALAPAPLAADATVPQAPQSIVPTAGNASVKLNWWLPSGHDGGSTVIRFEYQYNEDGGDFGSWTAMTNSDANTQEYWVTGLTNGTAYTFKVRAVNAIGDGAASAASASVTPAATAPPAATDFTATPGNAEVSLSWTSGGDGGSSITGWEYDWTRGSTQQPSGSAIQPPRFKDWTSIPNSGASTTSYTVTGLANWNQYRFRVRAVNAIGNGKAVGTSGWVVPKPQAPPAPGKPVATAGHEHLVLSWSSGGDGGSAITGWDYRQKTGGGDFGDWTEVPNGGASTRSYKVTGLTNGTAYQFKVRAVNARGDGAASPASDPAIPAPGQPPAPGKPAGTAGNAEVALSWTSGGDGGSAITGWDYRQNEDGGSFGDWTEVPNGGASTRSHTVTGLTNGTAYRFKVRAVNANGHGVGSPPSDSVTPRADPPAAPGKPTATASRRSQSTGQVALSWTSGGDGGSAILWWEYRQKTGASEFGPWREVPHSGAGTTSYTVTGLANGTAYRFKVRAINARGNGAASPASDSATPASYPPKPAAPTVAASSTPGVLNVSWSVSDGGSALTRQILRWKPCSDSTCYSREVTLGGSVRSRTLPGLKHGTTYYVSLYVENDIASGGWSPQASATTAGNASDNPPDDDENDNGGGATGGGVPPGDGDGQGGGVPPGGDGQGDGGGQDDGDDDDGDGVVPDPPSDPPPRWVGNLALEVAADGTVVLYWKGEWTSSASNAPSHASRAPNSLDEGKAADKTLTIEARSRRHGWQELMTGISAASGKVRIEGLDKDEAYTLRLRRETAAGVAYSDEIAAVADGWRGRCRGGARYMCLRDGRFEARVHWSNPDAAGDMGNGGAIETPISDESGLFWFFDPANIELVVKVLDGRELNGAHWVFFGALTDVEYWLTVRDATTGMARTYHNPPKEVCGQSDLEAFEGDPPPAASGSSSESAGAPEPGGIDLLGFEPASLAALPLGAPASSPASGAMPRSGEPEPFGDADQRVSASAAPRASAGTCVPGAARLCLLNGRFALEVRFIDPNVTDPEASAERAAAVLPSLTTEQTGFFWFFDRRNIELAAKVLDGRALNGRHWLLYGGLSDVEYTLTVTDTVTGMRKEYENERGNVCGRIDTDAF